MAFNQPAGRYAHVCPWKHLGCSLSRLGATEDALGGTGRPNVVALAEGRTWQKFGHAGRCITLLSGTCVSWRTAAKAIIRDVACPRRKLFSQLGSIVLVLCRLRPNDLRSHGEPLFGLPAEIQGTQAVLHHGSSLCSCHDQQLLSLNPSQERILLFGTSLGCQPPQTMDRQALALA